MPVSCKCNSLNQPLDVAVFGPIKRKWREILDKWRRESGGILPKDHFPNLLSTLWNKVKDTVRENLTSGFRTCVINLMNANEVLKKILEHCLMILLKRRELLTQA